MAIDPAASPSQGWNVPTRDEARSGPNATRYVTVKVSLDMILALLILSVAWPLILLLMVLVRLTSRGPALYRQVRLGRNGQPYTIYKIRTMVHDCEMATGPRWSTLGDPRVTRLGRWLRRYHLDELPQLGNVLRGEMSLVGPRPERPEIIASLAHALPGYRERLRVRPGITGLAQIQLPPDEDYEGVYRKLAYDRYYIRSLGLGMDLRILGGTVLKVLGVPFPMIRRVLALPTAADVLGDAPPWSTFEQTVAPVAS